MVKPTTAVSREEKNLSEDKNPIGIIPSQQIIPFPERLKQAIGNDSTRAFASKCGLDPKTLRNYLAGKQFPTLDRLALIAEASGKSISWLAFGEIMSGAKLPAEPINEKVLLNIITAIEIILKKKGGAIEPSKKAQIITMIYKLSIENKSVDNQLVKQAVELAS